MYKKKFIFVVARYLIWLVFRQKHTYSQFTRGCKFEPVTGWFELQNR